jgi:NAD(P)-dependent dehydrogenase (short-subunit alcohol dehydrogenase family)
MTKAAAMDYAESNVRINAVGPGPVEKPPSHKGTGGDPSGSGNLSSVGAYSGSSLLERG